MITHVPAFPPADRARRYCRTRHERNPSDPYASRSIPTRNGSPKGAAHRATVTKVRPVGGDRRPATVGGAVGCLRGLVGLETQVGNLGDWTRGLWCSLSPVGGSVLHLGMSRATSEPDGRDAGATARRETPPGSL
jgi:hypothetical protein